MFYDLQDISIPFPEYQITEDEKFDIVQRVRKLVDEYDYVDCPCGEGIEEELYSFFLMNKNANEYIVVYFGITSVTPLLAYLTPNRDWVDENPLAFLLRQAKEHPNTLRFHRTVSEDENLVVMADIREQLHIFDMLPRDRESDEYESAYIEAMQLLLMMLHDIDYGEIKKSMPKIDEELESIFPVKDIDPEGHWKEKYHIYVDSIAVL